MKDIAEAEAFIAEVLGDHAARAFSVNMDDFVYYAKSVALTELDTSIDSVRKRFENISIGILGESVKVFLEENYTGEDGHPNISVEGANVYDSNMQPIAAIDALRSRRIEVVDEMINSTMSEFSRGRRLARTIVARLGVPVDGERNYDVAPPLEQMEVELMRLERLLPRVSAAQAKRMMELYSIMEQYEANP